jgi:hypothetical protein
MLPGPHDPGDGAGVQRPGGDAAPPADIAEHGIGAAGRVPGGEQRPLPRRQADDELLAFLAGL